MYAKHLRAGDGSMLRLLARDVRALLAALCQLDTDPIRHSRRDCASRPAFREASHTA
jgi:hypothetical protein